MKAYLYSPTNIFPDDKSDFGLMKETFDRLGVNPVRVNKLPKSKKAFVVIAGAENFGHEDALSNELSKIGYVILFITSDESGQMDVDKIVHKDIKIWVQSPYAKHGKYYKMPIGAPAHMHGNIPEYTNKEYDVFFSGQVTHQRRVDLANNMPKVKNAMYKFTEGFMQGLPLNEYYSMMAKTKIIPAPAGNVTIDSFRLYEGIELMCIPIGDTKDSSGNVFDFWRFVFDNDIPFPTTNNWSALRQIVDETNKTYTDQMHQVVAWWIKWKRDFAIKIKDQYYEH